MKMLLRITSGFIACVMVFYLMVSSGFTLALTAHAEDPGSTEPTATEPSVETTVATTQPTEESVPETEATTSPVNPATIGLDLSGCTATDLEGNPISTVSGEEGEQVSIRIVPDAGYSLSAILLEDQELTPDENGLILIAIQDGLTIKATCVDTEEPRIQAPVRANDNWAIIASYTVQVRDNSGDVDLWLVDGEDRQQLSAGEDGNYSFSLDRNGSYTILAEDAAGNTAQITVTEDKLDQTAPVISDVTRNSSDWSLDATFSFTAEDTDSGISSVTVTSGDTVTALTPDENGTYSFPVSANGTYTLTAADAAGNAVSVDVTENRIDTAAPVIGSINRQQPSWSKTADYVFEVVDDGAGLDNVTLIFANGASVKLLGGSQMYGFTLAYNTEFTIVAEDKLGHKSESTVRESMIDSKPPEISQISRTEEGWKTSVVYAVEVADEQSGIYSVVATFGEETIPLTEIDGQYKLTVTQNGTYTLTVTDNAGNEASREFEETQIDTTGPVLEGIRRNTGTWSQSAFYTFTAMDTQSGIAFVQFQNTGSSEPAITLTPDELGSYVLTVSDNGEYKILAVDILGNTTQVSIQESQIDLTPPEIGQIQPQFTWDAETNLVTFHAEDNGELTEVSCTDSEGTAYEVTSLKDGKYQIIANKNGVYTLYAADRAGNTVSAAFEVSYIDTEAPGTPELASSAEEKWVNTDVQIVANATDSQSGIAAYWYTSVPGEFSRDTWTKMVIEGTTGSVVLADEQDTVYFVVAEDAAGRISPQAQIQVRIDKTAPADTVLEYTENGFYRDVNGLWIYKDVLEFTASAKDDASGIAGYEYRIQGSTTDTGWIYVAADENGIRQEYTGTDDILSVSVRVYDVAQNVSQEYTVIAEDGSARKIALENTPKSEDEKAEAPAVTATEQDKPYGGNWTSADVTATVSGSQASSGIEYYEYRFTPADPGISASDWEKVPTEEAIWKLLIHADTNGEYFFRAVTYAGNPSKETSCTIRVQKTVPQPAVLSGDKPTGTNGWHTVFPQYSVQLPQQNSFFAPVTYKIKWSYLSDNWQTPDQKPEGMTPDTNSCTFDGTNAPKVNKDGYWEIVVYAVDEAGNTCSTSASRLSFKVDTKAPDAMTVQADGQDITQIYDDKTSWNRVVIQDRLGALDAPVVYELFKKANVSVTVTADGGTSSLDKLYYLAIPSREAYTQGGWKELDGSFELAPNEKYNLFFKAVDGAGNVTYFEGKPLILDDTSSEVKLEVSDSNKSSHGFFYDDATVRVSVREPAFGEFDAFSGIKAINYRVIDPVSGEPTQTGRLYPGGGTEELLDGRLIAWNGSFAVDAKHNDSNHIRVEVTVTDAAGNSRTSVIEEGEIKIDITKPAVTAGYDNNSVVSVFESKDAFTGSRTLTVTVRERNFVPEESVIKLNNNDRNSALAYSWTSDNDIHTAVIPVTADGHYSLDILVKDAAGNTHGNVIFADGTAGSTAFILDNTRPEISVSYDNNDAKNEKYFAADRTLTVTVQERNFRSDKIQMDLQVTLENGTQEYLSLGEWTKIAANTYQATVPCSLEGVYDLMVAGSDALNNKVQKTQYTGTSPNNWILDKHIDAPVFTGIVSDGDYSGEVVPVVDAMDVNMAVVKGQLEFVGWDDPEPADVTDLFLGNGISPFPIIEGRLHSALDVFTQDRETDGIYKLTVFVEDKAGNVNQNAISFTVNRHGSLYEYDPGVVGVMGGYLQKVEQDLVLTEYNPSGFVDGSVAVYITKDGSMVAGADFFVESVSVGGESWSKNTFRISKDNFAEDGVYEVVVSTRDNAGNIPENTADDQKIRFAVDTTAPELVSVVGMEKAIYKADSIQVSFTANDNIALRSIVVYLNGEILSQWEDIEGYQMEGSFTIPSGLEHHVRIVITDKAGNVLDTNSESFRPGYGFQDSITVSTNIFLRYYANKGLFFGSLGVAGAGTAGIIFLLAKKKKAKKE